MNKPSLNSHQLGKVPPSWRRSHAPSKIQQLVSAHWVNSNCWLCSNCWVLENWYVGMWKRWSCWKVDLLNVDLNLLDGPWICRMEIWFCRMELWICWMKLSDVGISPPPATTQQTFSTQTKRNQPCVFAEAIISNSDSWLCSHATLEMDLTGWFFECLQLLAGGFLST